MSQSRLSVLLVVSTLANAASAGIFEDNPPKMLVHLLPPPTYAQSAPPSVSTAPTRVTAWLQEVRWLGCNGGELTVLVEEYVDLGQGFSMDVPRGRWCAVEPELLDVEVTELEGTTQTVEVTGALSLPLTGMRAGWLTYSTDGALPGELMLVGDLSSTASSDE